MEELPPRLLVAEPQDLVRELLVDRLVASGFDVVASVPDGRAAMSLALQHQPDVVILDIELRDPDGTTVIREMMKADKRRRIVVLTATDDVLTARYAIHAGAMAFVSKNEEFTLLLDAVSAVLRGDTVLAGGVTDRIGRRVKRTPSSDSLLSDREEEVLSLVASGLANPEIASRLFISARTVKNHLASIYDKLGVGDKTQALIRAVRLGIVEID
jgi:DNA-binding NarL/FixJ family response regulator